jgi:hypothetical protein
VGKAGPRNSTVRVGEVKGATARHAEMLYRRRFPEYEQGGLTAYRFYRFRPRRLKVFDERELGMGVFVTAKITGAGRLEWERTEIYRAGVDARLRLTSYG